MLYKKKNKKDVLYILKNLRNEDRLEALTQKGKNYIQELLNDIINTDDYVLIGTDKNNVPVCMGGIAKTNESGVGIVWLLSTPEIINHQISLLKKLSAELKKADEKYWFTFNILYKENELAKKWLSKFGFKFDNPKPIGLNIPKNFEFFYRKRETRGLK